LISAAISIVVLASEEDIYIAFQAQKAPTLQHGVRVKNLGVVKMPLALK
jgi:hypothetical protein